MQQFQESLIRKTQQYIITNVDYNYSDIKFIRDSLICTNTRRILKSISKELFMKNTSHLNKFPMGHAIIMKIYELHISRNLDSLPLIKCEILPSLHDEVWMITNGDNQYGNCFVCTKFLSKNNFTCTYIIDPILGGMIDTTNLRATCVECDILCGMRNLFDFKLEYSLKEK